MRDDDGDDNKRTVKIELLSQLKLEAEFRNLLYRSNATVRKQRLRGQRAAGGRATVQNEQGMGTMCSENVQCAMKMCNVQ